MSSNAIAIIGVSGRFPGAADLEQFYRNLSTGTDSVTPVSAERLANAGLNPNEDYAPYGHLDRVDLFDHDFFGVSRREAENMHPEQRLALELACEAIESAGYRLEEFSGSNTAVYMGGSFSTEFASAVKNIEPTIVTGNLNAISAGRISHFLNLNGPAMMVDTACSSSLVAIHEACRKIIQGEADYALAGGVFVMINFPKPNDLFVKLGIHSPDGKCKTFDKDADGIGGGEGGGVLLLKRLDKALADKNQIFAVIKGSAVNHDGARSNGLTAPSPVAQAEVIKKAWADAGISPLDISYIETHGTGTKLGDPIELQGLTDALGAFAGQRGPCAIGSLKTNIGHLNAAAGVAGVIKCILSFRHKELFPSLHFNTPNPFFDFNNAPVYVNTELKPWPAEDKKRYCGISSFGLSGTNVHMVLEEASANDGGAAALQQPLFLKASARTMASLKRYLQSLSGLLRRYEGDMADLLYTLNKGRGDYDLRTAFAASDRHQLADKIDEQLEQFNQGAAALRHRKCEVVLLLSESAVEESVVNKLGGCYPVYREAYREVADTVGRQLNAAERNFTHQYAFCRQFDDFGINIHAVVASGTGKIVRMVVQGERTLQEALKMLPAGRQDAEPVNREKLKEVLDTLSTHASLVFLSPETAGDLISVVRELSGPGTVIAGGIPEAGETAFTAALRRLYVNGVTPEWNKYDTASGRKRVSAPTYHFDRLRCWPYEYLESDDYYNWFYQLQWKQQALTPAIATDAVAGRTFLMVADKGGLAAAVRKKFPEDIFITVIPGDSAIAGEQDTYTINPASAEDVQWLMETVQRKHTRLDGLLYLADFERLAAGGGFDPMQVPQNVLLDKFNLLKALAPCFAQEGFRMLYVSGNAFAISGTAAGTNPLLAATVGLFRSLQADYPHMKVKCIDFDSGSISPEQAAVFIAAEMNIGDRFFLCAYREDGRYIQRLARMEQMKSLEEKNISLKRKGVYIITGGATGIGLVLGKVVAEKTKGTIIVLGRTPVPDRALWDAELKNHPLSAAASRIKGLTELEAAGASALYYAVDVADAIQMEQTFEQINTLYKNIDGVIHSAGAIPEWVDISEKSYQHMKASFDPKITGTLLLHKHCSRYHPSVVIYVSSLNAIVPQKYSIEYTAANAFLDAFAACCTANGQQFLSIDWPGWGDTGMVLTGKVRHSKDKDVVLKTISSYDAARAFNLCLRMQDSNLVIAEVDLKRFSNNPFFEVPVTTAGREEDDRSFEKRLPDFFTPMQKKVAAIWHEVLNLDRISLEDNFFERGGHSLNATQVISRIREKMGVTVDWKSFFSHATLGELTAFVEKHVAAPGVESGAVVPVATHEGKLYRLSSFQESIWLQDQADGEGAAFNMPMAFQVDGVLDLDVLQQCINMLVVRHEVFRTSVVLEDGVPMQMVHPAEEVSCKITVVEMTPDAEQSADEILKAGVSQAFNLQQAPWLRVVVVKTGAASSIVLFVMHHIIGDIWSLNVLLSEVKKVYNNLKKGLPAGLKPLESQYIDFALWQHKRCSEGAWDHHREYWKSVFPEEPLPLELPQDFPRPVIKSVKGAHTSLLIPADKTAQLARIGREHKGSPFMVLMSLVYTLLYKYSRAREIVLGMPVSARDTVKMEAQIGAFINVLPVKVVLSPALRFDELVQQVKASLLNAMEHKEYPLPRIVSDLNVKREPGRAPLFDILVNTTNTVAVEETPEHPDDLVARQYFVPSGVSIFDINFTFNQTAAGTHVFIDYNNAVFSAARMQRMTSHFHSMLDHVLQHPDVTLDDINLLPVAEQQAVIAHSCGKEMPPLKEETVLELLAKSVGRVPNAIAVTGEEQELTYDLLNRLSDQLAYRLITDYKVGQGEMVGVVADSNEHLLVIILGIFKAGAVYTPIDNENPGSRTRYILDNAGVGKVIVNNAAYCQDLPSAGYEVILYRIGAAGADDQKIKLNRKIRGEDLAYVIYTSGSTGQPKGVKVTHANLLHTISASLTTFGFDEKVCMPVLASYFFDIFLFEVLNPLLAGGRLIMFPRWKLVSTDYMQSLLGKVNTLHAVPSLMKELLELMKDSNRDFHHLERIFTGGDAVPPALLDELVAAFPHSGIYVLYGPTEGTIICSAFRATAANEALRKEKNIIGTPLPDVKLYILEENGRMAPVGIPGEICIAGPGVTAGYLNNKKGIAGKFVDNPFPEGGRMYCTGDLGWRLETGEIIFAGRKDNQVKVRGFRIELGEIENVLLKHQDIREAIAIIKDNPAGGKYIVAYFSHKNTLQKEELKRFLTTQLPRYMVPDKLIGMEELPKTRTGKVNRKALAELPDRDTEAANGRASLPVNELQQQIAAIWKDILLLPEVDIHDSFFELGGDSLKAMRLISRLQKHFSVSLSLRDIFRYPTVRELSGMLRDSGVKSRAPLMPAPAAADYPLSHHQQRLWILHQFEDIGGAYNITKAVYYNGALDLNVLEQVLQQIIQRHEVLRTVFPVDAQGNPRQAVQDRLETKSFLQVLNFEDRQPDPQLILEILKDYSTVTFDLKNGPLFSIVVVRLSDDACILNFVIDHIIFDGWSWKVFVQEFLHLYDDLLAGSATMLPELPVQYKDFSVWQRSLLASGEMEDHRRYWKEKLQDAPFLELPPDYPREKVRRYDGATVSRRLPVELYHQLKQCSGRNEATTFMTLTATLKALFYLYTGQEDIVLGTITASREHEQLEAQLGFYANTLAMRTKFDGTASFKTLLQQVRDGILADMDHQTYPFDLVVEEVVKDKSTARSPLFDILVVKQEELPVPVDVSSAAGRMSDYPVAGTSSKFDMTFEFFEDGESMMLAVEYCTSLFKAETVQRIMRHFESVLQQVLPNEGIILNSIDCHEEGEQERLLLHYNDYRTEYPRHATIAGLFEQQAELTPEALAVVTEDKAVTYEALNTTSNQLAHYLIKRFPSLKGKVVALMMDRAFEVPAIMLGILKAGAAYLPIDIANPGERIAYMLENAGVEVLITTEQWHQEGITVLTLPALWTLIADGPADNPEQSATAEDLAYVIYTSGSTGQPKGVMVEQRGVVRLVRNTNFYNFGEDDRLLLTSSLSFDVATFEIWGPLLNGGRLHLLPYKRLIDSMFLKEKIAEWNINIMWFTSSWFNQLLEEDVTLFAPLECLMIGGDRLSVAHVKTVRAAFPSLQIINGYGPTENTTFSTCFDIHEVNEESIPIGFPVSNSQVYILNACNTLLPEGAVGEICLAGDGLARGYIGEAGGKQDAFGMIKIGGQEEAVRIYRSGDLGRWLSGGRLEFIGRKDTQLKVRGFRIEPGEIEYYLNLHEAVAESCVTLASKGEQRELVAYIVSAADLTVEALRLYLSRYLPAYMLPSIYVQLDSFQLTANGKLDRSRLPDPFTAQMQTGTPFKAAASEVDSRLLAAWEQVLERTDIGTHDNFFDLGGNSLKLVKLFRQLADTFPGVFKVSDLFSNATIISQQQLITLQTSPTLSDSEEVVTLDF